LPFRCLWIFRWGPRRWCWITARANRRPSRLPWTPTLPAFSLLHAQALRTPGEVLSLFAVGLGAVDGNQTVAKLSVLVGGVLAEVVDSTVSASFFGRRPGGSYRVRFVVPPGTGFTWLAFPSAASKATSRRFPLG